MRGADFIWWREDENMVLHIIDFEMPTRQRVVLLNKKLDIQV